MKTINALAVTAFVLTLTAYLFSESTPLAPAQTGGDRTETDGLPPKRRSAPETQVPTLVTSPLKAEPGPNPTLEALRSNNVCGITKLKQLNFLIDPNDVIALGETVNPSFALAEYLSADGPLLTREEPKKKYTHRSSRFLLALRLAGMLSFVPAPIPKNHARARKMFLALEKEEPGNAAYPYFRLAVEKQLNFSGKALRQTANQISAGSFFEFPLDENIAELNRAQKISPAHFMLLMIIKHSYNAGSSFFDSSTILRALDPPLPPEDLAAIARLLTHKAAQSTATIGDGEYSTDQYIAGMDLAPQEKFPSIYQLSEERTLSRGEKAFLLYPNPVSENGECDSREFEEFFYQHAGKI